jgi:hypothetical protein
MYKETLRAITGVGIFSMVSLLLFVAVFMLAVVRACRMRLADAERFAALPLEDAPPGAVQEGLR